MLTDQEFKEQKRKLIMMGYGTFISYFDDPDETLQLASIESDPNNIKLIKNPTEKVKSLALELKFSK
jgi:hypothetical protein